MQTQHFHFEFYAANNICQCIYKCRWLSEKKNVTKIRQPLNLKVLEYSETCLERPLKEDKNFGQTYCRMLPLEHSAILLTFINLPFAIKTFVLSIFEWPLKTCFTVYM